MIDDRLDRIGPDFVSLGGGAWKIEIDQHFLGQCAIGLEEFVCEIEEDHFLSIAERGDELVGRLDLEAERLGGFFTAGEDRLQEDRRLGTALLVFLDDCFHALGDLFGGVAIQIARAGEEDDELGVQAIDLAVLQPPEHGLRGIAGVGKVEGVDTGVARAPHGAVIALRVADDRVGVAVKNEIDIPHLPRGIEILLKMVEPGREWRQGGCGRVGVGREGRCGPVDRASCESGRAQGECEEGGEENAVHGGEGKDEVEDWARSLKVCAK